MPSPIHYRSRSLSSASCSLPPRASIRYGSCSEPRSSDSSRSGSDILSDYRAFFMPDFRLGDIIDDHCIKCRRVTNHAIVSLVNAEPAKVRCRTCYHDHDYRHEQAPPSKKDLKKAELFKEVLAAAVPGASIEAEAEAEAETEAETEVEAEVDGIP